MINTIIARGRFGDETITGSLGRDLVIDFSRASRILGLDGDDLILAYGGNDVVEGGAGDDEIFGGNGDDQLFGYALFNDEVDGADIIHGGNGDDYIEGGLGVDKLFGGAGDDEIWGGQNVKTEEAIGSASSPGDFLAGNDGNDRLFSGRGAVMLGGNGDDELTIGSGPIILNPVIDGDFLTFEVGGDFARLAPGLHRNDEDLELVAELTGGAGADHFHVDGASIITDFNRAEGDTIEIEAGIGSLQEPIAPTLDLEIALGQIGQQKIAAIFVGDKFGEKNYIVGYEGEAPTFEDLTFSENNASFFDIPISELSPESTLVITEIPVIA